MIEVGAFEAKNTLGALLDRVEQGEEVVITRYGRPVARLVSNAGRSEHGEARAAADRIRQRATQLSGAGGSFNWAEWKAYRDAGRP